jgi:hypothetical protein
MYSEGYATTAPVPPRHSAGSEVHVGAGDGQRIHHHPRGGQQQQQGREKKDGAADHDDDAVGRGGAAGATPPGGSPSGGQQGGMAARTMMTMTTTPSNDDGEDDDRGTAMAVSKNNARGGHMNGMMLLSIEGDCFSAESRGSLIGSRSRGVGKSSSVRLDVENHVV